MRGAGVQNAPSKHTGTWKEAVGQHGSHVGKSEVEVGTRNIRLEREREKQTDRERERERERKRDKIQEGSVI
jgi:hypothetical protein